MRIDIVAKALKAIEDANGRLTAEAVVKAAEPDDHPLHDKFEWDDSIAGPRYRLMQARRLIKSVAIEVKTETIVMRSVAYMRDPAQYSNRQGYRNIHQIAADQNDAHSALAEEFARVAAHMRRVRDAAAMLGLGDQVSALLDQVTLLRDQVLASPTSVQ